MARPAGRTREETRDMILGAAAAVLRRRGLVATLDEIAREAGLSKGALVYHFSSKDELVLGVAEAQHRMFRAEVMRLAEEDDEDTGRLTRAYVRACIEFEPESEVVLDSIGLTAQLMTRADVVELAATEAAVWRERLQDDGLPFDLVTVLVAAADGVCSGALWGSISTRADRELALEQLVALTRAPERWASITSV